MNSFSSFRVVTRWDYVWYDKMHSSGWQPWWWARVVPAELGNGIRTDQRRGPHLPRCDSLHCAANSGRFRGLHGLEYHVLRFTQDWEQECPFSFMSLCIWDGLRIKTRSQRSNHAGRPIGYRWSVRTSWGAPTIRGKRAVSNATITNT